MAEAVAALGIASSVIAVLQLATAVGKQAYKYGESARNAKADIDDIVGKLKDLEGVLVKLGDMAKRAQMTQKSLDHWPALASLEKSDGPLNKCKAEIGDLQAQLLPVEGWLKRKQERVQWPIKKGKIGNIIERIEKQKEILIESLSIEQM